MAAIFSLPTFFVELGWLHSLIPLPVFYYLTLYGQPQGTRIVALAAGITGLLAAIFGALPSLLFSFTLLPLGFILHRSALRNESILMMGSKGVGYIACIWLLFGVFTASVNQSNPYQDILHSLDQGFDATYALYENSGKFSADDLKAMKTFIDRIRIQIARLFPGLLLVSMISIVWLNITAGHWLLKKKDPSLTREVDFKTWRLPELLVWPVIASGLLLVAPQSNLNTIGMNLGLVLTALYFTQGLAVLSSMLAKWAVPPLFRFLLYSLLLLQVYGIVLLAALGLIDVWAEFRTRRQKKEVD